jgi:hypothetical protein
VVLAIGALLMGAARAVGCGLTLNAPNVLHAFKPSFTEFNTTL